MFCSGAQQSPNVPPSCALSLGPSELLGGKRRGWPLWQVSTNSPRGHHRSGEQTKHWMEVGGRDYCSFPLGQVEETETPRPGVSGCTHRCWWEGPGCLLPTPQFTLPAHGGHTLCSPTLPPSSVYTQAQASSPEIIPPLRDGAPPPPSLAPCLLPGPVGCLQAVGAQRVPAGGEWPHSGRLFGCVGVCVCAPNSPAARLPGHPPRHQQPRPPLLPRPQPTVALGRPRPPRLHDLRRPKRRKTRGRGAGGAPVELARPAGTDNQGGLARPRAGFVDSRH